MTDELAVDRPTVSVVLPVRDEAATLAAAVASALAQDCPGGLEIVIAVAPSADGTAQVAERLAAGDPRVRVVDNPRGTAPAGLNRAVAAARAPVVARVDGHAQLPPGYLRRALAALRATGADNVGGVQRAVGATPFENAVAAAMTSRFGAGDARFHVGGPPGPVDTVYLGVFRRAALERVGGFDERLVRNQDYELNWRLRDSGGTVWFDPGLAVDYRPRGGLAALARQYFDYGRYKQAVARQHPRSLRWRQLVAPAALVANVAGLWLGLAGRRRVALAAPGTYAMALAAASARTARGLDRRAAAWLPVVYATMHGAWGLGFLIGVRVGAPAGALAGVSVPDDA